MPTSLRYVVLHHTGYGPDHFDLLLETSPGADLASWRCSDWPLKADSRLTKLPDHRRAYLEYEGEVSNHRGRVKRVAAGEVSIIPATAGGITVRLDGGPEIALPNA